MGWPTLKKIDASLDFSTKTGGLELIRPTIPASQKMLSLTPDEEQSWQMRIRHCDQVGVGILGHALDIIAFVAAMAWIQYEDFYTRQRIDDPQLQSFLAEDLWHDSKDIEEIIFFGVRELNLVAELYLIEYPDQYGQNRYDIVSTNQFIRKFQVNQKNPKRRPTTDDPWFWEFRLRDESRPSSNIIVEDGKVHRCFNPKSGATREAYAPTARILTEAELNLKILKMFERIADSNSLVTKIAYLGQDDGQWMMDQDYKSQFSDPTKAVPPVVNDLSNLARGIKDGKYNDPWQLMMGPVAPTAVDLTTSFDKEAREQINQNNIAIATGLNAPATLLLEKSDTSHFHEFVNNDRLRNFASDPTLKLFLRFLFKHVFEKEALKRNYKARLGFTYDKVMRSTLNPAQFIELFKIGAVGMKAIARHLNLSEEDMQLTAEDIRYRRELVTGDSGLQQEQLAQRYGQDANAVSYDNPLTNGQKRQETSNIEKVDAALNNKKKQN